MNMTVYLDIVFIENILMNYIILFGTGTAQKIKMKNINLILSSAIGALYAVISYLQIIPIYSKLYMKILLSMIMIYIAFYPQNIKKMLKSLTLFYLISFATGGCALALLYIMAPSNVSINNGIFILKYPMKVVITSGLIGFIIIQCSFNMNKRKLMNKDLICNLKIKICGKTIKTKAFMDSGNSLKDPFTKKPVIIVEKKIISEVVDIEKINGGDSELKIRLIPFKTIGNSNGMLMGIQSEYAEVEYDEEKSIINNVIIGIYDKKINKKYSALVGLNFIDGGNKSEYNSDIKKNIFQYERRK